MLEIQKKKKKNWGVASLKQAHTRGVYIQYWVQEVHTSNTE